MPGFQLNWQGKVDLKIDVRCKEAHEAWGAWVWVGSRVFQHPTSWLYTLQLPLLFVVFCLHLYLAETGRASWQTSQFSKTMLVERDAALARK